MFSLRKSLMGLGFLFIVFSAGAQQKPNTGWLRVDCNDGYDKTSPRRISVYRNGKLYNQTEVDPIETEHSYYNFPTGPVEIRVQVGAAKPEVKSAEVAVSNGNLDTSTVVRFSCRALQPTSSAARSLTSSGAKSPTSSGTKSPSWPVYSQSELEQCRKHLSSDGGGSDKDSPVHQRCVAVTCTDQIRKEGGYNGSPVHQLCLAEIAKQTAK
jgi:hypothetical protein